MVVDDSPTQAGGYLYLEDDNFIAAFEFRDHNSTRDLPVCIRVTNQAGYQKFRWSRGSPFMWLPEGSG